MKDLVAAAKAKPVTFSSAGSGSPGHLAAEVFTEATGAKITHVPYKGNTPAVTAVLAGEVNGGVLATPGMLPHVKAGKITPLAVTSRKRSTLAPDIPTVAEAGLPQLEQEVMYLAMVPAATPSRWCRRSRRRWRCAGPRRRARAARGPGPALRRTGRRRRRQAPGRTLDRYGKVIRVTGMKVE